MDNYKRFNIIDVICEMKSGGEVVPIRIQVHSDDGELQQYNIRNYRILHNKAEQVMPDGVPVTGSTTVYECVVPVFGMKKAIFLYFNPSQERRWWLTVSAR